MGKEGERAVVVGAESQGHCHVFVLSPAGDGVAACPPCPLKWYHNDTVLSVVCSTESQKTVHETVEWEKFILFCCKKGAHL
ncbi:hypothetical protein GCM10009621_08930 [Corynebacterium felinum]